MHLSLVLRESQEISLTPACMDETVCVFHIHKQRQGRRTGERPSQWPQRKSDRSFTTYSQAEKEGKRRRGKKSVNKSLCSPERERMIKKKGGGTNLWKKIDKGRWGKWKEVKRSIRQLSLLQIYVSCCRIDSSTVYNTCIYYIHDCFCCRSSKLLEWFHNSSPVFKSSLKTYFLNLAYIIQEVPSLCFVPTNFNLFYFM